MPRKGRPLVCRGGRRRRSKEAEEGGGEFAVCGRWVSPLGVRGCPCFLRALIGRTEGERKRVANAHVTRRRYQTGADRNIRECDVIDVQDERVR